jgi:hypothetical protein
LFGIYLGQIDDSKLVSGSIHVSDAIHLLKEELVVWDKK